MHNPDRIAALRHALKTRLVVADGAMGTMLQAADLSLSDFEGHEGCNEILNVTRPDVVAGVHRAYFDVGVDCVETNTFGANLRQPRPSTTSPIGSTSLPRPARGSLGMWPTIRGQGPEAPLRARLDRARNEAALAGARRLRAASRRVSRCSALG